VATDGGSQINGSGPGWGHASEPGAGTLYGNEYYVQVQVKSSASRFAVGAPAPSGSANGKLFYFTLAQSSAVAKEIVTEQPGSDEQFFSMYRSVGKPMENDAPGSDVQPGNERGQCFAPGNDAACWLHVPDEWETYLYHIKPGRNAQPETVVRVWAANDGDSSHTKTWDFDEHQLPYTNGSPRPHCHNAVIATLYTNGLSSSVDYYFRVSQMIFSTQSIPCPQ
jgi:hypothetical protein